MTDREVLFEFTVVGEYMRAAAIDVETGIEVVVMGPAAAPREGLERIALRKLEKALEAPYAEPSAPPPRKGTIV
jgi:hypothetical protein